MLTFQSRRKKEKEVENPHTDHFGTSKAMLKPSLISECSGLVEKTFLVNCCTTSVTVTCGHLLFESEAVYLIAGIDFQQLAIR